MRKFVIIYVSIRNDTLGYDKNLREYNLKSENLSIYKQFNERKNYVSAFAHII